MKSMPSQNPFLAALQQKTGISPAQSSFREAHGVILQNHPPVVFGRGDSQSAGREKRFQAAAVKTGDQKRQFHAAIDAAILAADRLRSPQSPQWTERELDHLRAVLVGAGPNQAKVPSHLLTERLMGLHQKKGIELSPPVREILGRK